MPPQASDRTSSPSSTGVAPGLSPIDRDILDAAADLFYQRGIQAAGVNAIIAEAGVAKATFYGHFPSKDALVLAWLRQPETRWLDRIRAEVERKTRSPERRMLMFFDELGNWFSSSGFRGCPFFNVAIEVPDPKHPARKAVVDYTYEVQSFFADEAARGHFADPQKLASQLFVLVPGAIMAATIRRSSEPAALARAVAKRLIDAAPRS